MSDSEVDTSRVVVQAYIPAYQRDTWDEHADELGMTRSEYVRTMVQAGRRGFGGDPLEDPTNDSDDDTASETTADTQSQPGGDGESTNRDTEASLPSTPQESDRDVLERRVVDALREADVLSWDELLAAVTDDIESQLETTMQRLQAANTVHYSGRKGGYVYVESESA